jgi:hypothetical protein
MKHAGPEALDELEPLLVQVRHLGVLRERKRGSFDSRYHVTLHFHEDETGLYADLRLGDETRRFHIHDSEQADELLKELRDGIERAKDARAGAKRPVAR